MKIKINNKTQEEINSIQEKMKKSCLEKYGVEYASSIIYGFNNKISPEIIGDINNLCITKKYINSGKGIKSW
ncbi:MAG: hypothetical protein HPY57_15645 [Ignavibacteria bacterium]|nr:hypothetical protein [Ignavibacteria bacterium]